MDGIYADHFDQTVKVWPAISLSIEGDVYQDEPDVVDCRVEEGVTVVTQGTGLDTVVATKIISHDEIPQDARVALPGDDVDDAEDARTIIRAGQVPSLDGSSSTFVTYVG